MSERTLADVVYEGLTRTFEGMTFMMIDYGSGETPSSPTGDCIWARLAVKAPSEGAISLVIPVGVARELGTIMFSPSDELDAPTPSMLCDMMAEFVNTLGGRVMRILVPENEVFELGLPDKGQGVPESDAGSVLHYEMDENPLWVLVSGPAFAVDTDA